MADETPGLDLDALRGYLDAHAPGLVTGDLSATVVAGGRSNLTYRVGDGTTRLVVRRPPLGHVLASAHDMSREHRVMTALAGTSVPVPGTHLLCEDDSVLGAPFYVMDEAPGTAYRRAAELAPLGAERTRAIGERLVDTLATLHAVDPAEVGLGDFGRPDGYLERQVRTWKRQLDASHTRDVDGAGELHAWLEGHVPTSPPPAIVHGDYRLDNVLVDGDDQITAVLDWEMATLGDPVTDVALMVAYQEMAAQDTAGAVTDAALADGYPSVDEVLQRYAATSGRDLSDLGFYLALAYFKLAVILEGIHYRYVNGQTVGEGFDSIGAMVPSLVRAGLAARTA
ncbi:phosphotransferase family protein [Solicola sp. PLA-1-18]|uniref:phosphotransferase family protein n=1 Tax=Solicola sp. PLA-1-18 TaxID=3380532 RepID=UPI003B7AD8AE